MSVLHSSQFWAILVVLCSIVVQIGFAVGLLGPAWLSPILSIPALTAITWLWRRAEKENQSAQAFERLVI